MAREGHEQVSCAGKRHWYRRELIATGTVSPEPSLSGKIGIVVGRRKPIRLDEHLGWREQQLATPGVQESVVTLAATYSFREASKACTKFAVEVLSATSVQRLLWGVAGTVLAEEKEAVASFSWLDS